jgi:hypothetical protein
MKIDVNTQLLNLDHTPAMVGDQPLTARRILIDSLMLSHDDDARMSGKDKVRLVKLALKIDAEDEPDFPAEDVSFLVARVDKMCPPLTVYRIREILDPASL